MKIEHEYYWVKSDNTVKQMSFDDWLKLKADKKRVRIIGNEVMLLCHNHAITIDRKVIRKLIN